MKRFDQWVTKLHFKRILITYFIVAVIAAILAAGFLGYAFKEKIIFALNYQKVSEKVEDNRQGIEAVKPDLNALAEKSPDITDILVLNSNNQVIFSAKSSALSKQGRITLQAAEGERGFLTDTADPDVYYKLIRSDRLVLSQAMIGMEKDIKQRYDDEHFYENNFNNQKVYLLSYLVDRESGDKIYFISDIKPVTNGEIYVKAVAALAILFFTFYWVLVALWLYASAAKAKLNSVMWGILGLFTNLAGVLIYWVYRQNNQTCFKCQAVQSRANAYCTFCGTKLGETCPNCHKIISRHDRYCRNCGTSLNTDGKSDYKN